jgi:predicted nicotinamide N-methyase
MKDPLKYRYQTIEIGEMEIHIRSLRDMLDFYDEDLMTEEMDICNTEFPLFALLWPSSFILAQVMLTKKIENLKILEIGCGLAFSSLLLRLRGADIKATDNHPSVAPFLDENIRINQCESIPFVQADWKNIESDTEKFDLIIGSDVLYQQEHLSDLCQFINKSSQQKCEVVIVDPNRGNHNHFKKKMKDIGFTHSKDDRIFYDESHRKFKGQVHYYHRI